MKLQCACGAKYAFDITPEMTREPVKFVCPSCGLDSSDFVNELVRRELGNSPPTVATPVSPVAPAAPAVPAAEAPRLKISRAETSATPSAEPVTAAETSKFCPRHLRERVTENCAVCQKPICPKCMEMFGFCSVLCKAKAEAQNINMPVYAGQKSAVEARFWRKTGLVFGLIAAVIISALAFWTWYAWFGSIPHTYFSVRFADDDRAYSGKSELVGQDQIIFLHGGTLARYDLKTKKQIWSQELVTKEQIAAVVKQESDLLARENSVGDPALRQHISDEQMEKEARIGLASQLQLRVSGQNVWIGNGDKLTYYDWDSGKVAREITLPEFGGELVESGGELLMIGAQAVTHINLASGETRAENFSGAGTLAMASTQNANAGNTAAGGLPLAGADNSRPLDPNKVAAQAQNLTLPARIALPALLGNASHEQQLEAALKDDPQHLRSPNAKLFSSATGNSTLVPGANGFVQFSTRLLEERIVTREAMRAPPKKSVLNDANLNASQTAQVANETLNEMQRNNGGDKVSEDESHYQVTVHIPNSPGIADWSGEVVGPPQLFALKTVNVVAAGKMVIVLDQTNKKLWEIALTYNISAGSGGLFQDASQFGAGPCVEHGDTLYVFDEAVLSAFDLSTGNARWRLPSVGVVGLFFDDAGNLFVNTTTGNPDDIKYSRQIDISKSTDDVLLKIDPKTGKTLWSVKPGGFISYLSGKFIYTVQSYDPNPTDEETMNDLALQKPAYFRIARINPENGRTMWEYYDSRDRCPVDVRFKDNSIELVFKREVQVLKYLTF
jgi:PQQ-like domain